MGQTDEQDQNQLQEEGFKTCRSEMPTPKMRKLLRMTAARTSILSGGTPFKEVGSSGKKFNRRKKLKKSNNNNTSTDSNETFIRHERDVFDRDSLEYVLRSPNTPRRPDSLQRTSSPKADIIIKKFSPEKKSSQPPQPDQLQQQRSPQKGGKTLDSVRKLQAVPSPISKHQPTKKQQLFRMPISKPPVQPKVQPLSRARPPTTLSATMGRNSRVSSTPRNLTLNNSNMSSLRVRPGMSAIRPRANTFKKPNDPPRATSPRTRLTRAQSFKSTAELEREYFNSLRSRF